MEQLIPQLFEHEEFGKIRVIKIDGEANFVAADVCRVLEVGNVSQALARLDDDEKGIISVDTLGGPQKMLTVNESGFYALVLTSRKPIARKFRKWVTNEVLPSIRETGSYSVVDARRAGQISDARVYIVLFSDGTVGIVKIGCSSNVRRRVAEIKRQNGLTVSDIYFSPLMSREDARFVEWACQEKFSAQRVSGEFFSVEFATARAALDEFVEKVFAVPLTKPERVKVF